MSAIAFLSLLVAAMLGRIQSIAIVVVCVTP
jgi:hypothetical protein